MDVVVDTETEPLTLKDGDSDVLELAVSEAMFESELLVSRETVGDPVREELPVDETLVEMVLLVVLLNVTLCVGRRSTVKLWDVLMESDEVVDGRTLRVVVVVRVAETDLEDEAIVVKDIDDESDRL